VKTVITFSQQSNATSYPVNILWY